MNNKKEKHSELYFTWKFDDSEKLQLGTSTQEIQKVYWESEAGSLMVEVAIDNLNKRIEELENKIK